MNDCRRTNSTVFMTEAEAKKACCACNGCDRCQNHHAHDVGSRPMKLFLDNFEDDVIRPPPNSSLFVVGPVPTAQEEMMQRLVEKVHGNHHHHHKCSSLHILMGPGIALVSTLVLLGSTKYGPETASMYLPPPSLGLGLVALGGVASMSYSIMTRFNAVGSGKMGAAVVGGIAMCSLIVLIGIHNVASSQAAPATLVSSRYVAASVPFWRTYLTELIFASALMTKIAWYQFGSKIRGEHNRDLMAQLMQPITQCKLGTSRAPLNESVKSLEKDMIYI